MNHSLPLLLVWVRLSNTLNEFDLVVFLEKRLSIESKPVANVA